MSESMEHRLLCNRYNTPLGIEVKRGRTWYRGPDFTLSGQHQAHNISQITFVNETKRGIKVNIHYVDGGMWTVEFRKPVQRKKSQRTGGQNKRRTSNRRRYDLTMMEMFV